MIDLTNKKILVTGGTGLIGRALINQLLAKGCTKLSVVSLDRPEDLPECVAFKRLDLRTYDNCVAAVEGQDIVFSLIGLKTSPKLMRERPASIFVPYLQYNTNLMEAAVKSGVEWYLYTSSVGVYNPSSIMHEDDVWKTFPSTNDWFAGWAKRMGELQTEAYVRELGRNFFSIIRPSAIFGTYDNFNKDTAMFIPAIISRVFKDKENPLKVWGDGSALRDFLIADEVARAMIFSVENEITAPLNVGSGRGVSIKEVLNTIQEIAAESYGINFEIQYDVSSINKGDDVRIFDIERIKSYGFTPTLTLKKDLKTTIDWFVSHNDIDRTRFSYL